MQRFKLIKEYPGSPKLGESLQFWAGKWSSNSCNDTYVLQGHPVDYPEFWEEVDVKEYEILSFIANRNIKAIKKGIIIRKNPTKNIVTTDNRFSGKDDSLMYSIIEADEEKLLKNSSWGIHSVKRVSDEEVFSIGDRIKDVNTEHVNTITSFSTKDDRCFANGVNIYYIEKADVLFLTEDGVAICEGDKYWKNNGWFAPKPFIAGKDQPYVLNDKAFSTKEAAEEYILMNKPCLSVNDIETIACVRKQSYMYNNTWIDEVKRLVKKRL